MATSGKKLIRNTPPSTAAARDERWQVAGLCLGLAALTFAVFGQTLRHEFINFDDGGDVYDNPVVARGLTLKGMVWAFSIHSSNWFPLTWLSHMLDCQLYGLHPWGHHLTNVLLHTATVIVLFLVLRQMTCLRGEATATQAGNLWRSAFVAAVFAIHPLRVESVAWVAERKDVLSGLFFMLTIGAYVRYARHSWSPARYGLVTLLFALGLMCKPMLVTLPLVLLLLDYWPLNRVAKDAAATATDRHKHHFPIPQQLVFEKLPWFGLSLAASVVTIFTQKDAIQSFAQVPFLVRLGDALISYVAYLGQMFWPSDLALFYPLTAGDVGVSGAALSLVLLAGISAGVFVLRRQHPYLLTGWLWYLLMLAPVIGIFQVGLQARADRYTYLPQIGVYLMLSWAVAELCAGWRHRRMVLGGCATLILAALIFCARTQVAYWRNSESLWAHTLACTTANSIAHYNLGNFLIQTGRTDDAIAQYQLALHARPDYADAHYSLGNVLLQRGKVDDAIVQFQLALHARPDNASAHYNLGVALLQKGRAEEATVQFQAALQSEPGSAAAYNGLGNALLQRGKWDDAISQFHNALQSGPASAEVYNSLGSALLHQGSTDEAISQFQLAVQLNPGYAAAHNNLGNAFLRKDRTDEAIAQFQMALQFNPNYPEFLNNLAWVWATASSASLRNGNKAVELARQANELTGAENPVFLHTLAAALAEAGQFSEATRTAQKALELARAAGRQDLAAQLNEELKRYEAGLPLHQ